MTTTESLSDGTGPETVADGEVTEPPAEFGELLDYLKRTRGFDFTGYKADGLARRFQKRMQIVGADNYADYRDYLEVHPSEFNALFNAILINVTAFFRDPEAWTFLAEDVIPPLLARKEYGGPIRIWTAGCASGEEAYTVAMLLAEALGVEQFGARVKIYATDVDEEALTHARQAAYTARDVAGIPEALLAKYFDHGEGSYVFKRELRRSVIFGRNDLVQDAPISRVDLLTCRNTLMYLNAETQARILSRFHFALNEEGSLFLGKAEMLFAHTNLFQPRVLRWRVFTKISQTAQRDRLVLPPRPGDGAGDLEAPLARQEQLRELALDTAPLAQVVIDTRGVVALINAQARGLFRLGGLDVGRPLREMDLFYQPTDLRRLVEQAQAARRPAGPVEMRWSSSGEARDLDVLAAPLLDRAGVLLGVSLSFTDVTRAKQLQMELEETNRELETAYEELQSSNEELETTNEELQSINEELETTNEELQSTNEELETTNEELQSTNEELHNINDEMRQRSAEMDHLDDFMTSLLASMPGGVAVTDQEMQVLSWSRKAEDLWGLRADEAVGRHFLNLDIGLPVEQIRQSIRACLSGEGEAQRITVDAVNRRGRAIRCRVTCSPLMGQDGAVSDVILLMEDVIGAGTEAAPDQAHAYTT